MLDRRVQFNATTDGVHGAFNVSYRAREGGGPQWLSNNNVSGYWYGGLRNISCQTQDTIYSAHVRYANFIQEVTLEVIKEDPVKQSVEDLRRLYEERVSFAEGLNKIESARRGSGQTM